MRIAHLILSNFYLDNAFYQENILTRQNKIDGHEVLIIASTQVYTKGNTIEYTESGEYLNKDQIKVIRVPYKKIINNWISDKMRFYKSIHNYLNEFKPDIIFSHGFSLGSETSTVIKYLKNNPSAKLYIDTHTDSYNSATNFISKIILHKLYHRSHFKRIEKYAQKIYYIAPESKEFLKNVNRYNNEEKLEYMPLGGYLIKDEDRLAVRKRIRDELEILDKDIVFIHSGKFDAKKRSFELLKAFNRLESKNIKLLIIGSFNKEIYKQVEDLINQDERILFLGWKSGDELQEYLCAGDVYIQPGGRTVTVQNAVCNGCVIVVSRMLVYTHLFGDAAIYAETEDEIYNQMKRIVDSPNLIIKYRKELIKIAKEKLDYRVLANRYIEHALSLKV